MVRIRQLVNQAKRRLFIASFGRSLCYSLSIAALFSTIAIITPLYVEMRFETQGWIETCLLFGLIIALGTSLVLTWLKSPSETQAAQEVDRRFELRERLSSALSLGDMAGDSTVAKALIADTEKSTSQIYIADKFAIRPTRLLWLPCCMLSCLLTVCWLVEPNSYAGAESITENQSTDKEQITEAAKVLKKQIQQRRKKAATKGLAEAEELYGQLESKIDRVISQQKADPKQTMIAMNDLKKQLEERSKELGTSDAVKRALSQLNGLQDGASKKMLDALKNGDFQAAKNIANQLSEQLNDGNLSDGEKEQIKQQLDSMSKAMEKAVKSHEEQKQRLENQIAAAKQSNNQAEISKLQKQLDQLKGQNQQMESLGQMAQSMSEAMQAIQSNRLQEASEALEKLSDSMQQMQQESSELDDLEATLEQIAKSKSAMQCKSCSGSGCADCNGAGSQLAQGSSGSQSNSRGNGNGNGNGLGKGSGFGDRPESETETNTYQTQVRGELSGGKAVIAGVADGPNRKGISREELKQAIEESLRSQGSPTENQVLPKAEREHAMQYFNQLRESQ